MTNRDKNLGSTFQQGLFSSGEFPGGGDDDTLVRATLADAIKRSTKKRTQIAEELSVAVGRAVTETMLNLFTAESKEGHRWPLAWTRAFCQVTGDWRLLQAMAERAGFQLITAKQAKLLRLAEQLITREKTERSLNAALKDLLDEEGQ
jgi:hypothetical protein